MDDQLKNIIDFMRLVGQLKRVKRTGWVNHKVEQPESVSDHMYRMAVLAMLIPEGKGLRRDHCMKMAIVHDLAECIVGDIAPADGISKEEKYRREKDAMKHLAGLVDPTVGLQFCELWEEYEDGSTEEAKFVKDLDKFEMILQAFEYETLQNRPMELQDFFDTTKGKFTHPTVQEWVKEVYKQRWEKAADQS
ncbi:HD domain-containing protein 2-like isoform X2 [Acanthaster planci]|uniref:5'-deoxynucleotidase HDDC2 n=1 Tax=Acanthaster planci TaxID=133434 RepID=A0A8B7XRC9_ACAPL|nr:HD domain-containing protein 2-like isoform X2 [Acanthaster planci]